MRGVSTPSLYQKFPGVAVIGSKDMVTLERLIEMLGF